MREFICTVAGFVGAFLANFLGGWDTALECLAVFMVVDIITGLIVALIFHNSPKNSSGKVESKQFLKGLFKKITMLIMVGVGHLLDRVLGVDFVRVGTICTFVLNEVISITENCALMGIPIPKAVLNALEILSVEEDKNVDNSMP